MKLKINNKSHTQSRNVITAWSSGNELTQHNEVR